MCSYLNTSIQLCIPQHRSDSRYLVAVGVEPHQSHDHDNQPANEQQRHHVTTWTTSGASMSQQAECTDRHVQRLGQLFMTTAGS